MMCTYDGLLQSTWKCSIFKYRKNTLKIQVTKKEDETA